MFFSPAFFWIILGLLLVGAEMFTSGFVIFFFGLGAVVTGLFSLAVPPVGNSIVVQGILWIVSTVLFFRFLRKKFTGIFKGTVLDKQPDDDVGQSAVVVEAITPDKPGRVKYQGTSWKAVSYTEEFDVGEIVDIVKEDSLTFTVSKHLEL